MARRVFLHVAAPKTGTTYLQSLLYSNRRALRRQGMLLPGSDRAEHRWAALVVRQDPKLADRMDRAAGAWDRIVRAARRWKGDVVVSHEFFGSARGDQAGRAVADLEPAETHVVVTAREPLGQLTAAWQQTLKTRSETPLDEFSTTVSASPHVVWNWRGLDVGEVLGRWGSHVPPDRVHVVVVPRRRGSPTELWERFAGVLGLDSTGLDLERASANATMGLAQAETLRRINPRLREVGTGMRNSTWLRQVIAERHLVTEDAERFWPGAERVEECRARGRATVEAIRSAGYQVVGDLDDLLVPDDLPERRTPADVTDAEVAEVLAALAGQLLGDARDLTRRLRRRGTAS